MSGGTWTPERRAAQAERMRKVLADPEVMARRVASIASSPKVAAARRRNASKIANDPVVQEKARAWRSTPEGKAALADAARKLNELRRVDGPVRDAWLSAMVLVNCSKNKREAASRTLKRLHQTPEFREGQTIRLKAIQQCPIARALMAATRRAGKVPKGASTRYRKLRDMIGPQAAMAIVKREAKMARVNR